LILVGKPTLHPNSNEISFIEMALGFSLTKKSQILLKDNFNFKSFVLFAFSFKQKNVTFILFHWHYPTPQKNYPLSILN